MIVKDVDENSAEPAEIRADAPDALAEEGMRVGEGIDSAMLMDAAQEFLGEAGQGGCGNKVRQEIADAKGRGRF
jgi:hypothetical protein